MPAVSGSAAPGSTGDSRLRNNGVPRVVTGLVSNDKPVVHVYYDCCDHCDCPEVQKTVRSHSSPCRSCQGG
jgi:hypothetical protein